MNKIYRKALSLAVICTVFSAFVLTGCGKNSKEKFSRNIAVYVPGIIADSPIYAKLADGAQNAVEQYNKTADEKNKVGLKIVEGGTNQAEWPGHLTTLCAEEKYDVIVSSNPSLPELVEPLTKQFPKQKFILLDAMKEGNESIVTARYAQDESAFITGFVAGLMTKTGKIGLITAQEYPVMNQIILPGYEKGAKSANEKIEVDFRIVGNWYDAKKGAELADAMSASGVDVILPICGGACQGVIASAKEHQTKLCFFDSSSYGSAPGLVISCVETLQEKLTARLIKEYLDGTIKWGSFNEYGMKDGYVRFNDTDPLYIETVPENIRSEIAKQLAKWN